MTTKNTVAKKTIRERLKDASDVIGAVTVIGTACVYVGTWSITQINASTNKKLAQYYFGSLDGDWYMSSLFTKWAEEHGYTAEELTFMKESTK